jgi:hypothetical protein
MRWLMAALLAATVGCGGSGELSRDEVTSIGPGDATGTDRSGRYRLTVVTAGCVGACPAFQIVGSIYWTICKPGATDRETVMVTQKDGFLEVTGDSSLWVQTMSGGLQVDGRFDVGGYETEADGEVQITARVKGTIDSSGSIVATARARGVGSAEGKSINCTGTYDVTGARQ